MFNLYITFPPYYNRKRQKISLKMNEESEKRIRRDDSDGFVAIKVMMVRPGSR